VSIDRCARDHIKQQHYQVIYIRFPARQAHLPRVLQHRHHVVSRPVQYGALGVADPSRGAPELLLAGPAAEFLDHCYAGHGWDVDWDIREFSADTAKNAVADTLVSFKLIMCLKEVANRLLTCFV
jgi:hypothetical protein